MYKLKNSYFVRLSPLYKEEKLYCIISSWKVRKYVDEDRVTLFFQVGGSVHQSGKLDEDESSMSLSEFGLISCICICSWIPEDRAAKVGISPGDTERRSIMQPALLGLHEKWALTRCAKWQTPSGRNSGYDEKFWRWIKAHMGFESRLYSVELGTRNRLRNTLETFYSNVNVSTDFYSNKPRTIINRW